MRSEFGIQKVQASLVGKMSKTNALGGRGDICAAQTFAFPCRGRDFFFDVSRIPPSEPEAVLIDPSDGSKNAPADAGSVKNADAVAAFPSKPVRVRGPCRIIMERAISPSCTSRPTVFGEKP